MPLSFELGLGLTHTPSQGVGGAAPTIASQTVSFGALTLANAGGAKAVNLTGAEVDFVSVDSVISGDGANWTVSSGRLVRSSGTPASSDGAVLRCTTSVGVIDVTISTIALAYSFTTKAELVSLTSIAVATLSGRSLYGRRDISLTSMRTPDTTFRNKAWSSTVTLRSHDPAHPAVFDGISISNSQNFTVREIKFTDVAGIKTLVGVQGLADVILITRNEICATVVVDPNADWSAGYAGGAFNGIGTANSTGLPIGLTITDNYIHDVRVGINVAPTGAVVITGNEVARCYEDSIKVSEGPSSTLIDWNFIHHNFGAGSDTGAPHADGIQLAASGSVTVDWINIIIRGNIVIRANARAAMQGIFADDKPSGYYFTAIVEANFVDTGAVNSIKINRAKDCLVRGNTAVGPSDQPYGGAARSSLVGIQVGSDATSGTNTTIDNISESFSTPGTVVTDNNVTLGKEVALPYTAYNGAFAGPIGNPDTKAQVLAWFAMLVGGSADGAFNAGAIGTEYVDFEARTYTAPR